MPTICLDMSSSSEEDSFVASDDPSSDEDDLSFSGVGKDGEVVEDDGSDIETLVNECDNEEELLSSEDDEEEKPEVVMIFCHLCKNEYRSDNFSPKRQRMHSLGTNPKRIFCLLHTSTSDFGADWVKKGEVKRINHSGERCGTVNRNVFRRRLGLRE